MKQALRFALVLGAAGLLISCTHEPFDEALPPLPGEIGDGPGLISGAEGGFYIVGGDRRKRKY